MTTAVHDETTTAANRETAARSRLLVIQNVPTPYRLPLFAEMDRQLRDDGIEMLVVFGAQGYGRRKWHIETENCGFRFTVLGSRAIMFGGDPERTTFTYPGLTRVIRQFAPDLVLVAGFSLATVKTWLASRLRGVPYIIWSGSRPAGTRLDSRWRRLQRRFLAGGASAGVAYGTESRDYLVSLGIPAERVFIGINTVDTRFFAERTRQLRQPRAAADRHVFTYVGYLSARKNVGVLLEAVRQLRQRRQDFVLDIVGDGDDRPRLEQVVRDASLGDVVQFHGYRQRDELPAFFARSSAFLYQTDRDIWGLVLNEAMAAGLPCLSSINAGATHDLVRDGETGFAIDFTDTARVCDRLTWIMDHPAEAAAIGQRASAFIASAASISRSAGGFVDAVTTCLQQHYPARRAAAM